MSLIGDVSCATAVVCSRVSITVVGVGYFSACMLCRIKIKIYLVCIVTYRAGVGGIARLVTGGGSYCRFVIVSLGLYGYGFS